MSGGTPDAVFGSKLKVFTLAVKPRTEADIAISYNDVSMFLADGVATRVADKSEMIYVAASGEEAPANALAILVLNDQTPP